MLSNSVLSRGGHIDGHNTYPVVRSTVSGRRDERTWNEHNMLRRSPKRSTGRAFQTNRFCEESEVGLVHRFSENYCFMLSKFIKTSIDFVRYLSVAQFIEEKASSYNIASKHQKKEGIKKETRDMKEAKRCDREDSRWFVNVLRWR